MFNTLVMELLRHIDVSWRFIPWTIIPYPLLIHNLISIYAAPVAKPFYASYGCFHFFVSFLNCLLQLSDLILSFVSLPTKSTVRADRVGAPFVNPVTGREVRSLLPKFELWQHGSAWGIRQGSGEGPRWTFSKGSPIDLLLLFYASTVLEGELDP